MSQPVQALLLVDMQRGLTGPEPGLGVVLPHDGQGPHDLDDADLVVVPCSRATVADLAWLRERGLVADHAPGHQPEILSSTAKVVFGH